MATRQGTKHKRIVRVRHGRGARAGALGDRTESGSEKRAA